MCAPLQVVLCGRFPFGRRGPEDVPPDEAVTAGETVAVQYGLVPLDSGRDVERGARYLTSPRSPWGRDSASSSLGPAPQKQQSTNTSSRISGGTGSKSASSSSSRMYVRRSQSMS